MRKDGKNERLKDMNNKQALGFFKDLAKRKDDAQSVKLGKSDFTALDAKFLLGGGGI